MLIQITNRCHMGCPHCMQESGPKGRHMTEETFEEVLRFVREAELVCAVVHQQSPDSDAGAVDAPVLRDVRGGGEVLPSAYRPGRWHPHERVVAVPDGGARERRGGRGVPQDEGFASVRRLPAVPQLHGTTSEGDGITEIGFSLNTD